MPKMVEVKPNACPHRELEFDLGGRVVACRDCGQRYHAVRAGDPGVGWGPGWTAPADELDHGYYNVWVLHRDRRTWAPALAEPVKPQ